MYDTAAAEANANVHTGLAVVPKAVPELPDILLERPEMIAKMRGHLLGFAAAGTLSLASTKRSKLATKR